MPCSARWRHTASAMGSTWNSVKVLAREDRGGPTCRRRRAAREPWVRTVVVVGADQSVDVDELGGVGEGHGAILPEARRVVTLPTWTALAGVVLVGGEALFDLVLDSSGEIRGHAGGGPFNAARTVARLGQPYAFLGRLSRDRLGRTLAAMLTADGVSLDAVVETEDPTTLALAEVDDRASPAPLLRARDLGARPDGGRRARCAPGIVAILHVGTLGLTLEPMARRSRRSRSGSPAAPSSPSTRTSAPGSRRRGRLSRPAAPRPGRSHVVKVSEEDVDWLYPGRPAPEAARALLDDGPSVALLTRGGEGALVVTASDEVAVAAPKVEVVDTIGAATPSAAGSWPGGARVSWGPRRFRTATRWWRRRRSGAWLPRRTCARPGAFPPFLHELGTDAKIPG